MTKNQSEQKNVTKLFPIIINTCNLFSEEATSEKKMSFRISHVTEAGHYLPQLSLCSQQYFEKLGIQRKGPSGVYIALTHLCHICPHSPLAFCVKRKKKKKIRHMLETLVTMEMMVHSEMGRLDFEEEEREGKGSGAPELQLSKSIKNCKSILS